MGLICQNVFDIISAVLSDRCLTPNKGNDRMAIKSLRFSSNTRIPLQDNCESLQQRMHTIARQWRSQNAARVAHIEGR